MQEGCPWRVHGFEGKWVEYWEVSIVVDHNCTLDELEPSHMNLISAFVANMIYVQIVNNLNS